MPLMCVTAGPALDSDFCDFREKRGPRAFGTHMCPQGPDLLLHQSVGQEQDTCVLGTSPQNPQNVTLFGSWV